MVKATIVVDLGFGDSGKGTIVDYLARLGNSPTVVRYNGGGQAGHNVVTSEGQHHTFSQFGAGSFVPGVRTHLSRFMLLDPYTLSNEEMHLNQIGVSYPLSKLTIDRSAKIVTPFHKAANRILETLRGSGKHGSVGLGIGQTMFDSISFPADTIYASDLRQPDVLLEKLTRIRLRKCDEFVHQLKSLNYDSLVGKEVSLLFDATASLRIAQQMWRMGMRYHLVSEGYLARLACQGDLIFEGAQGVLLDEWYGFHPYTTWSTTTTENALTLLREIDYPYTVNRLGVLRPYATRHGIGPLPTEMSGHDISLGDLHNVDGTWQNKFRVGWFDSVLTRYALSVTGGVDALALTNIDKFGRVRERYISTGYELDNDRNTLTHHDLLDIDPKRKKVVDIRVKRERTNLILQERLTNYLMGVKPTLTRIGDDNAIIAAIEKETRTPVILTSYGPTYLDKRICESQPREVCV